MSSRDPFPMRSKEAERLAASVEGQGVGKEWDSMKTRSAGLGPTRSNEEQEYNASESLVEEQGGTMKKKSKNSSSNNGGGGGGGGGVMDMTYDDDDGDEERNRKGDDFLDRPLSETRGTESFMERCIRTCLENCRSIYEKLYGKKLPPQEMLRTLCLASTLFFMIGGYWLLRSLKDTIMISVCGVQYIPKAKILSVFVVLGVVSIYNKLLDSNLPRHHLFYYFGSFYCCLFSFIALCLMSDSMGLSSGLEPSPHRLLGWISYCGIESFGSVMVSLFWSFANSSFTLETAKASYGVMVATAQVGSIIGPTVVNRYTAKIGIAKCYLIGATCMLLLQGTMYMYVSIYGVSSANKPKKGTGDKKDKAGVLEGLQLFWKHNYVKGIFAISCLFMVEVTIVDYTLKVLATEYFKGEFPCQVGMMCWDETNTVDPENALSEAAATGLAEFLGFFGQATNTLSLLLSLLGTSAVIRYLGFRFTLLLFPTLCLCVIIFVRLYPTLYVVFGAMICLKACSYALNNPTKEILYQPTSPAVKYKAKSWIDIFGARGSKALGSLVSNAFSDSATTLVANGSLVGMAVASFLIWNARFMGKLFDQYTESGYIVGGTPEDYAQVEHNNNTANDDDNVEDDIQLATKQNEQDDTSCAIYDDDQVGHEEEGQVEQQEQDNNEEEKQKQPQDGRVVTTV